MTAVSRSMALSTLLAVAAAASCDDEKDNYLDGSLTESYDLSFDSVRIRLYPSELSIEYVKNSSQGEKVALRITLDSNEVPLAADTLYDLSTQGSITQGDGYGSPLPDLETGELTLDQYSGTDGSKVKGDFEATFLTDNNTTLTLRGGFSAKLEVVD
jgi:hypothetical protein